jgi:DNA (cytosine-5)-methyltransferase 1
MSKQLNALSLFSGAGGMDIGVKQAGFEIKGCIELDPFACETLRSNIKKTGESTVIFETDIRCVSPETIALNLAISKKSLSLLFGGPPCQSFSLAGKQLGLNDDRGPLLFEIIRFAKFFEPKIILLEQVKGLLSAKDEDGKKGGVFERFLSQLEDLGYTPKWKVILAADFGIPQLRERLFIVATHGQNDFLFPEPTHSPLRECNGLFSSVPYTNVGDVIGNLGNPEKKVKGQKIYNRTDSHIDVTPERDRERIAQVPEGSYLAAQVHLGKELRCNLSRKDTTKYLRMHRLKPANTLRCGEIFYHPTENRYLTPREYMRIHGYSDDYELKGPVRSRTGTVKNLDQHRQVANSVPPPLAKILSHTIKNYLNE